MIRRLLAALILILVSVAAHAQCGGPGGGPGNQGVMGCPPASNFLTTDYLLGMQAYNGTSITNFPGKTVKVQPLQLAALIGGGASSSQFNTTFPAGGVAAGIFQGGNMVSMTGDQNGDLLVNLNGTLSNGIDTVGISGTNTATEAFMYAFNGSTWDRLRIDASKNLQVNCAIGCVGGTATNGTDAVAPTATNSQTLGFLYGFNGASWDRLRVDAAKNLDVNCLVGCSGGSFVNSTDAVTTTTGNTQTAAWLYAFNGATFDRLRVDTSKNLNVNCVVGCTAIGGAFNNNADAVATSATNGQAVAWLYAFNGTTWDRLTDDGSRNLNVNCTVGCVGGTFNNNADAVATNATNGKTAAWLYAYNGTTFDRLRDDGSENLMVNCAVGCSIGSLSNASDALATTSTNSGAIGFVYAFNGTTWDRLRDDVSKNLMVNCNVGCSTGSVSNAGSAVATSSTNNASVTYGYAFNGTTWDQLQDDASKNLKVRTTTDQTTPGTTDLVHAAPQQRTIVALDIATVTTGGTAVTALNAGHRTAGGWLQNPITALINLCINEVGTASGTTSSGSLTCVQPGQAYGLIPSAGAVSVISSDSAHPFSGYGLQ